MSGEQTAERALPAPVATRSWSHQISRLVRRYWLEAAMVTPLCFYVLFFMLVPVVESIYFSFVPKGGHHFTLANYTDVIHRSSFQAAVENTVGITLIGVTMEMVLGIVVALMLARAFRGRGIFRSIVLVPLGVPTLVAGAAMLYFVGFSGYLNEILEQLGIIKIPIYWTSSGIRGMFVIALADLWKSTPLVILILLAGLESIPRDVYEAASVDGASAWRRFWDQTLPLLMPSVTMALILRAIDAFRIFDIAVVLAGQSIPVMSSFVYYDYAAGQTNTAAAAAVLLLLLIMAFIIGYFLLVERRTEVAR